MQATQNDQRHLLNSESSKNSTNEAQGKTQKGQTVISAPKSPEHTRSTKIANAALISNQDEVENTAKVTPREATLAETKQNLATTIQKVNTVAPAVQPSSEVAETPATKIVDELHKKIEEPNRTMEIWLHWLTP